METIHLSYKKWDIRLGWVPTFNTVCNVESRQYPNYHIEMVIDPDKTTCIDCLRIAVTRGVKI